MEGGAGFLGGSHTVSLQLSLDQISSISLGFHWKVPLCDTVVYVQMTVGPVYVKLDAAWKKKNKKGDRVS